MFHLVIKFAFLESVIFDSEYGISREALQTQSLKAQVLEDVCLLPRLISYHDAKPMNVFKTQLLHL